MKPDDIKVILHQAGGIGKYENSLMLAAKMWRELPDSPLASLLHSIGMATHADSPTVATLGLYAFIGFVHTARLAAEGKDVPSETATVIAEPDNTEDTDKPWQLRAADWMESVGQLQDAEGLTGEPEPEWFRRVAAVLRKEPEYLARQKNKEIADTASDAIKGA